MRSIFYVGRRQFCRRDFEILAEHVHLQNLGNPLFPYGTLAVNCLGCLAIGFVAGLAETRSIFTANDRLFIFRRLGRIHNLIVRGVGNFVARKGHPGLGRADRHWAATATRNVGRLGRQSILPSYGKLIRCCS
jgi:hypothetical protein